MAEEVDADWFEEIKESGETWVLDFWAEWCGPCKTMKPIFEGAAEEFEDVHFGKVDVEQHQELAGKHGVRSIPTFLVVRDGEELDRAMGAMSESEFHDWVADATS